jgi:virulence-associated protein VagC
MVKDIAQVFMKGQSQMIQLPRQFRVSTKEVYVTQEDDRLVITPKVEVANSVDPELAALVRQAETKWVVYHSNPKQREEMYALRGCLKDSAIYDGLDGVAYQRKTRDEWDDR